MGTTDLGLHAAADTHPGRPHPERVIPARTCREGDFTREREKRASQLKDQQSQGQQMGGLAGGRPREWLPGSDLEPTCIGRQGGFLE